MRLPRPALAWIVGSMPHAPSFWRAGGGALLPALLAPLAALTAGATAYRLRHPGWRAPVPVICVGNATLGGAGKTTVALDLVRRLLAAGHSPHVLLRGYGGRARGPVRVRPEDDPAQVGDEALLHAALAPAWIGADRRRSAQAAIVAGAGVLVLDDGLQNPGLAKDLSLLTIDGATGFGNGRVFPAGPLREPVAVAATRCHAAVLIGPDDTGALARLPAGLPALRAALVVEPRSAGLGGRRVLAFTGIAVPDKFFASLAATGAEIVQRRAFPDHHLFTRPERDALLAEAERLHALPITTAKDAVRLPPEVRTRVRVLEVSLAWETPQQIDTLLATLCATVPAGSR
jgi:tetraacyldisaccharide 4'-kinase